MDDPANLVLNLAKLPPEIFQFILYYSDVREMLKLRATSKQLQTAVDSCVYLQFGLIVCLDSVTLAYCPPSNNGTREIHRVALRSLHAEKIKFVLARISIIKFANPVNIHGGDMGPIELFTDFSVRVNTVFDTLEKHHGAMLHTIEIGILNPLIYCVRDSVTLVDRINNSPLSIAVPFMEFTNVSTRQRVPKKVKIGPRFHQIVIIIHDTAITRPPLSSFNFSSASNLSALIFWSTTPRADIKDLSATLERCGSLKSIQLTSVGRCVYEVTDFPKNLDVLAISKPSFEFTGDVPNICPARELLAFNGIRCLTMAKFPNIAILSISADPGCDPMSAKHFKSVVTKLVTLELVLKTTESLRLLQNSEFENSGIQSLRLKSTKSNLVAELFPQMAKLRNLQSLVLDVDDSEALDGSITRLITEFSRSIGFIFRFEGKVVTLLHKWKR